MQNEGDRDSFVEGRNEKYRIFTAETAGKLSFMSQKGILGKKKRMNEIP
jgi:hypothetical protein